MADISLTARLGLRTTEDQQATISGAEYVVSDADNGQTRWIEQASSMALRWPITTQDRATGSFIREPGAGEVTFDEDLVGDAVLRPRPSGTAAIETEGVITWTSRNPTGSAAAITIWGMLKPAAS